ncbi:uncharacterized protein PHACADRAFT_133931 [Phanerochaete carnosa HHB-10118-sp]|uniref:C2H2-type domain-containing protein n=1 Tax=Phanerochaete carnosa (strain HHB-10118-sp) TaxID=650164 RepID=K5WAJ5_PHACS|nr:uncharacterized protein PHACADRAFT_133931 [Phanerochaete carnosa HHB-10118-sp]EKM60953.1 hypothetical protein PHACADRAFT_133931 [Phanerochaete carnosa HHB-10118-sp]
MASTTTPPVATTSVVLRKRKARKTENELSLRLETASLSGVEPHTESEYEAGAPNGGPSSFCGRERRYKCSHEGCTKAYAKPCRLAEHERSHTGVRPFTCINCNKSYLREAHLQAHARSHLPNSSRPLVCEEPGCEKRFWTAQHLRVHSELHRGNKPFKCIESSCEAAFLKHHQLREHICSAHAPPGAKPYRCSHPGCDKSFLTNQKLRGHMRTHDEKRYTCVHADCLASQNNSPAYYPTWTALQHHMRTDHPPKCPRSSCNGKTFKSQRGLRAHMKLHEQIEVEEAIAADSDADSIFSEPPRKKRRGGEIGRDWKCDAEGCVKDFKSKKALTNHRNVNHLGHRNFICPHESCGRAFGYKHLLQRHLGKIHKADQVEDGSADDSEASGTESDPQQLWGVRVDDITGMSYVKRAQEKMTSPRSLCCPFPDLHGLIPDVYQVKGGDKRCEYVFTRAYDFRRHLRSEHGLEVEKENVYTWAKSVKEARQLS